MHETGLVAAAVALLSDAGPDGVSAAVVGIGPAVDPGAAAAAWQAACVGTPVEGAFVRWQRVRDELRCLDCGRHYEGERFDRCPACTGTGLVVAPAPEITVLDWKRGGGASAAADGS